MPPSGLNGESATKNYRGKMLKTSEYVETARDYALTLRLIENCIVGLSNGDVKFYLQHLLALTITFGPSLELYNSLTVIVGPQMST
jgi:hypothetical protein